MEELFTYWFAKEVCTLSYKYVTNLVSSLNSQCVPMCTPCNHCVPLYHRFQHVLCSISATLPTSPRSPHHWASLEQSHGPTTNLPRARPIPSSTPSSSSCWPRFRTIPVAVGAGGCSHGWCCSRKDNPSKVSPSPRRTPWCIPVP